MKQKSIHYLSLLFTLVVSIVGISSCQREQPKPTPEEELSISIDKKQLNQGETASVTVHYGKREVTKEANLT